MVRPCTAPAAALLQLLTRDELAGERVVIARDDDVRAAIQHERIAQFCVERIARWGGADSVISTGPRCQRCGT